MFSRMLTSEMVMDFAPANPVPQAKTDVGQIEQNDIGAHATATGNQVTVNVHPPPFPVPAAPASQPQVRARDLLPTPQLDIDLTEGWIEVDDEIIQIAKRGGTKALLLLVRNRPAAQGEQARSANCVFASLEFKSGSRTSHVNTASWIGKRSNQIAIDVSQMEHVLIGFPDGSEWTTYNNPNRVPQYTDWPSPYDPVQKRTVSWGEGAAYIVDVKIISNDHGITQGVTFVHRQIRLERRSSGYYAKLI